MRADMIYCGNSAETIASWPDECVDCCVTSPPYYTALVAKKLNRHFVGVELNPANVELSLKRTEGVRKQQNLF